MIYGQERRTEGKGMGYLGKGEGGRVPDGCIIIYKYPRCCTYHLTLCKVGRLCRDYRDGWTDARPTLGGFLSLVSCGAAGRGKIG